MANGTTRLHQNIACHNCASYYFTVPKRTKQLVVDRDRHPPIFRGSTRFRDFPACSSLLLRISLPSSPSNFLTPLRLRLGAAVGSWRDVSPSASGVALQTRVSPAESGGFRPGQQIRSPALPHQGSRRNPVDGGTLRDCEKPTCADNAHKNTRNRLNSRISQPYVPKA